MSLINTNSTSTPGMRLDAVMSAADAHAALDGPGDAGAILDSGDEFVSAGGALVADVSKEIETRTAQLRDRLTAGTISSADAATEQGKLDVATRMRDSMATSVQKVADIVSGNDTGPAAQHDDTEAHARRRRTQQLDQAAVERHLFELRQQVKLAPAQPPTTTVAATYRT